jgi:protoheme IX farnesyltransferase
MRLGVSLAVSFSAITGYLVAKSNFTLNIVFIFLGVFLFAGGASALNQYQEKETDALMSRTKNRPIPSGKISPLTGFVIAVFLIILGFLILYLNVGQTPAFLGLLNLVWYNGLYTYLKKKTAFAVVPGSITGVTPLLIGWSAANLSLLNPIILFISFFIFMWQIPHFWLLHIKYADDYEKAGLGVLKRFFSDMQIKRIIFAWVFATSLTSLLLPYFGIIHSVYLSIILILINIWIVASLYRILFTADHSFNYKKAFIEINAFMIMVMLLLIIDYIF